MGIMHGSSISLASKESYFTKSSLLSLIDKTDHCQLPNIAIPICGFYRGSFKKCYSKNVTLLEIANSFVSMS
jgi:hypothetical protein